MIVDRYYYHQLNKDEQKVYKVFYEGVMAHQDIIPLPIKGLPPQDMMDRVFWALTRDNPLIYYINQSVLNLAHDGAGNIAFVPQYFFDVDVVKEYNRKIQDSVNGIAAKLKLTEGTEYDKELKVHDWLCRNVDYDEKGHDKSKVAKFIMSHNIIGVFAHHKAQCEGIAKAAKVLLNAVDVKCIMATGTAVGNGQNGPHAWNIVKINDKPYHLDITWDIGANQGKAVKNSSSGRVFYEYFNVTDTMITKTHTIDKNLPVCESDELNYFKVNGNCFKSKSQALRYVEKEFRDGKTEVYFRLEGRVNVNDTYKAVGELINKLRVEMGIKAKSIIDSVDDNAKTCWFKLV